MDGKNLFVINNSGRFKNIDEIIAMKTKCSMLGRLLANTLAFFHSIVITVA